MDLPIDARGALFKSKYLDEETPLLARWRVFGHHDDGTVDIAAGADDVIIHIDPDTACRVIQARDAFLDAVLAALTETPTQKPWPTRRLRNVMDDPHPWFPDAAPARSFELDRHPWLSEDDGPEK